MSRDILVVEDDESVSSFIREYLEQNGYVVLLAETAAEMRQAFSRAEPALVILDLMLPDGDGLELIKEIRLESRVPVIMLTGRSDLVDKVVGLEVGADDYLSKPFEPRELLARVRSILRRVQLDAAAPKIEISDDHGNFAHFDGYRIDGRKRLLTTSGGAEITLTAAEFDLLRALVEHPKRVLSREQLLDFAFGREMEAFERSIDVLIMRIRAKLEEDRTDPKIIKTVRGAGYIFTPTVEWS